MLKKAAGKTAKERFMKKGKFLVVGLIALLLAGGLVFAGCGGSKCGGSCGRNDSDCKADPGCGRSSGTCNCNM